PGLGVSAPAWRARSGPPPDTAVPLTPTLDAKRVAKWVKALAAKTYRAPVAGTVILRHSRPFFTHSHPGRALRRFPTRMMIEHSIVGGTRTVAAAPLEELPAARAQP